MRNFSVDCHNISIFVDIKYGIESVVYLDFEINRKKILSTKYNWMTLEKKLNRKMVVLLHRNFVTIGNYRWYHDYKFILKFDASKTKEKLWKWNRNSLCHCHTVKILQNDFVHKLTM